jgi:hypothetical protein
MHETDEFTMTIKFYYFTVNVTLFVYTKKYIALFSVYSIKKILDQWRLNNINTIFSLGIA